MSIQSINPATEEVIKSYEEFTVEEITDAIEQAHREFLHWRTTSYDQRRKLMLRAADILDQEKEKYGTILTLEMGKPIRQALAEVEKCAWVCRYYAENAEKLLKEEIIQSDASESYIRFDPLGVILAVMPWNFPYWQVFRFAAPALMAGNTALLKHSSNVPQSALAIEEVFQRAGFPDHVFKTLLIGSSAVDLIIDHPMVSAATLTGSEAAGANVASRAGKCLKKTVLELGGSDPFIILADADIEKAAETAVQARIINNGQSCIAAKRFIAVNEIAGEFEKRFVEHVKSLKIGDPFNEANHVGPLAREDLLNELNSQVTRSIEQGAELLYGGGRLIMKGYYYPVTVLSNVQPGMPVFEEETFGPVAALIKAVDEEEAVAIANRTKFGLGASLWTRDRQKAKHLAAKIESGSVYINGMVKSDPRLPFGGIKFSGYGRELSHYGIKEFVNIKTVWIR
ncbi:MAG: NAD-dependent succinate-semialdehyde dehydrogenase [Methanococcaceae archaeon]